MERKQFDITIQAAPEKIWQVLWGNDTYPQWTAPFSEGMSEGGGVKTDWQKGSRVLFVDSKGDGMVARIRDVIPNRYMSIEHLGEIVGGKEDTESEKVKEWAGAHEDYTLSPEGSGTQLRIDMDMSPEFDQMLSGIWPKALAKVKELSEKQ